MIAGFGDNASMYAPLHSTPLAERCELLPLNLPGFGVPPLDGETTLAALGEFVADEAARLGAQTIVAHSVASIIATLAAETNRSPLRSIISLEGNLTAEDAYFSGRAAEHDCAESFRAWFLPRIKHRGESDPILGRYACEVEKADPQALWELGCDARHFSDAHHPGERLNSAGEAFYLFNRENCAHSSIEWLEASEMRRVELPGASHWPTLDQPHETASAILKSMGAN